MNPSHLTRRATIGTTAPGALAYRRLLGSSAQQFDLHARPIADIEGGHQTAPPAISPTSLSASDASSNGVR